VRREVSVAFQSNKTAVEYAALARRVEGYGFDALSVYGDLMFQPPIGPLIIMAQATTRIRLGPASINPYTMHPVEIAGQIALLDAVSGGRAYLGLSRGAWLESLGIVQTKPVATMREAVAVVRHLLGKKHAPFDGEVFTLSEHNVLQYDVARADLPLMIGTWGPQLSALAGEVADEVKIGGCVNPAMVPVMRERIAVGAHRARRGDGRGRGRRGGAAAREGGSRALPPDRRGPRSDAFRGPGAARADGNGGPAGRPASRRRTDLRRSAAPLRLCRNAG